MINEEEVLAVHEERSSYATSVGTSLQPRSWLRGLLYLLNEFFELRILCTLPIVGGGLPPVRRVCLKL
jgi:hypothetical protein